MRDTSKLKLNVAMVPLNRRGARDWDVEAGKSENAFDEMVADIKSGNPGRYVCTRLSWVGTLGLMQERKYKMVGLTILCVETKDLKRMMGASELRLWVGGRKRFCSIWRVRSDTIICNRSWMVGQSLSECKATPEYRWCSKNHLSTNHKCTIVDSGAPKGIACMHCWKIFNLCESSNHFTGFTKCKVLRGMGSNLPRYGKATPVEADNTSAEGVHDQSRNRFRQTSWLVREMPVDKLVCNHEVKGDRMSQPKVLARK